MLEQKLKRIFPSSLFHSSRMYFTLAALASTYFSSGCGGCFEIGGKPYHEGGNASNSDTISRTEDSYSQQISSDASELPNTQLSLCLKDKDKDTYFDKSGNQPPDESGECPNKYTLVTYSPKDTVTFDCDGWDDDKTVHPKAPELCDGKDNDCDGETDEDLYQPCENICGEKGEIPCDNGKWGSCSVSPLPQEVYCDGKDDDCDGQTDENITKECLTVCGSGLKYCIGKDKWGGCNGPMPSAEICDGYDNDCDGKTDEDTTKDCSNACGSGVKECINGKLSECTAPLPATEVCDGYDNNCDGQIDEESNCCSPGEVKDVEYCPPYDFVFVIDNSGSMADSDPAGIRYAGLGELVEEMSADDRGLIITFNDEPNLIGGFTSDKDTLSGYITTAKNYGNDGGTNIGGAVYGGIDKFQDNEQRRALVLLSDGQDSTFSPAILKGTAEQKEIKLFIVGLGSEVDENSLKQLATDNGGYYFVSSADQIPEIYQEVFGSIKYMYYKECSESNFWVEKNNDCN